MKPVKRVSLILICLLLILTTASCGTADISAIPSDTGTADASDIPSDIEVVNVQADRLILDDLQQVEDYSTIIVESIVSENLGQEVDTTYDYEFQKDLPGTGFTSWEIEVTKVYKGDVKAGDKLVILQEYYIWTKNDGKKQLVTSSSLKPAVKKKKYLMFLIYDDKHKAYWPVCDYEGMFAVPTDAIKEKAKAGTLAQSDLDVYDGETLQYLIPIYSEVVQKYFS